MSTGSGLFTLEDIPDKTFITSYAPLAPVYSGRQHVQSDYIVQTTWNGTEVEVDGNLCPLGLGKIVQDGSFPFCLLPEKFSTQIKTRLNCEMVERDGEIWMRSTRHIKAGNELLSRYSHDNSYWCLQFSLDQLRKIRRALSCNTINTIAEAEAIIKTCEI